MPKFYRIFAPKRESCRRCEHNSQKNVNWVTTADGCIHSADTMQLDCHQLVANCVRSVDATQLDTVVESHLRRWCVLGIRESSDDTKVMNEGCCKIKVKQSDLKRPLCFVICSWDCSHYHHSRLCSGPYRCQHFLDNIVSIAGFLVFCLNFVHCKPTGTCMWLGTLV